MEGEVCSRGRGDRRIFTCASRDATFACSTQEYPFLFSGLATPDVISLKREMGQEEGTLTRVVSMFSVMDSSKRVANLKRR